MKIDFTRIHHIQLCVPTGEVDQAENFYCAILGLEKMDRFSSTNSKVLWLKAGDVEIHISEEDITSERSKRHSAFVINDLENVRAYLIEQGVEIVENNKIPGINRFSIYDNWNNKIELIGR